jgi:hypothetical protein
MRLSRWVAVGAGLTACLVVLGTSTSGAATAKGVCTLKGTAFFSPGLTTTAKAESYTFSGSLNTCQGTAGVKKGSVSASGSGSLGCGNGSSTGSATISWNTGASSSLSFTTTSAGNVTVVKGTITGGQFAGLATKAVIAFSTTTPQKCALGGLASANFNGPAELGI